MKNVFWIIISLTLALPGQVFANYERIVSINLCADQLLFALEDKKNIASISFLSHDTAYSPHAETMKDIPANRALVEEIIPLQPDLILAGNYTDSYTLHFLEQLGYRVEILEIPWNVEQIETSILQLGRILGRENRAHHIIQEMRARRTSIEKNLANAPISTAIILAPNGFTHGRETMKGDLLEIARLENLAASSGITGSGNIDIEYLLANPPDFIIIEDNENRHNSMAQRFLQHPALKRGLPDTKRIHINPNLWTCGSPDMMDALAILAEAQSS